MGAGLAHEAFDAHGDVNDAPVFGMLGIVIEGLEVGVVFQVAAQRLARPGRNGRGNAVDFIQRDVLHPAHVANGGPRGHRAEGDDLCHVLATVAPGHVLDHLPAPRLAKVDIDIGHLVAAFVDESLEQQFVL